MALSSRTIRLGLVVGFIGYITVAIFYAAFDLLAARGALFTVDLLGKTVFQGLRDPSILGLPIELDTTAIVLYTGLHLIISLAIGLIVAGVVDYSERRPAQARMALFIVVAGFIGTIVAVAMLTSEIRLLLPGWSIVVANILAVLLAGSYLVKKRPGTWSRLSPLAG